LRLSTLAGGLIFCLAGIIYAAAKATATCCVEGECVHQNTNSLIRSVIAFAVLFLPLAAGVAVSKDSYDQHAVLNRGLVEDMTGLPGRAVAPVTKTSNDPVIPAQALGADDDERASEPLPQDTSGAPPAQDTAANAGTNQANPGVPSQDEGSAKYLPRAADGNVALEVTDLLYGESEDSLRKMFSDKTIEVVGQYVSGSAPQQFKLVRMFIVCCAADARPLAVPVEVSAPAQAAEMEWVKVTGKATYAKNGDRVHVLLKADTVESTDPPAEAMLY